jgi:2'-hydroxyisoflavone reductase
VRLLVLGGTAWLGGYITSTAMELGHRVTCLARGASGSVSAGAVFVQADRDQPGAYDEVAGEQWDVVVDVSRQPGQVRRAVAALTDRSGLFVFVSSGNVYADHSTVGQDETAPLLPPLDGDVMESMETYGQAKVACEQYVLGAYGPDRTLIARVGLIGGPGDVFDRTGYWPLRFAQPTMQDGSVLVPDAPEEATSVIDVRDLARWIVEASSRGVFGIFNATGQTNPLAQHLQLARRVAGHTGPLVTADQEWLLAHNVQPWMGERSLPLWLADPDWAGFNAHDSSRAREAGLITRPLQDTLADTLAWEMTQDPVRVRKAGLSDDDERSLLQELATT